MIDNPFESLPNAVDAREKIDERKGLDKMAEAVRIVGIIKVAQQEGKEEAVLHPPIRFFANRQALKERGYKVIDIPTGINETGTAVSW